MSEDEKPLKQLAVSLSAMLAVAVVLGLVVGAAALGAFRMVGGGGGGAAREAPSLSFPTRTPAATAPTGDAQADGTPRPDRPRGRAKRRSAINLSVDPGRVSPMQRINLTGTYRGGDGATLQVQRFDGGWQDFPTTASVSGGTFATYVMTGRSGQNRFRVVDEASGRRSNPVTVRVG